MSLKSEKYNHRILKKMIEILEHERNQRKGRQSTEVKKMQDIVEKNKKSQKTRHSSKVKKMKDPRQVKNKQNHRKNYKIQKKKSEKGNTIIEKTMKDNLLYKAIQEIINKQ